MQPANEEIGGQAERDRLEEPGDHPVGVAFERLRGLDPGIHAAAYLDHVLDELGHQRNRRDERQRCGKGEAAGVNGAECGQESGHGLVPPVSEWIIGSPGRREVWADARPRHRIVPS